MREVIGVGFPSKIKSSGIVYLDKHSGKRYIQTQVPRGNSWSLIDESITTTTPDLPDGLPSELVFNDISFTWPAAELTQTFFFNPTLGSDFYPVFSANSSSFILKVWNMFSIYTGTTEFTMNGDTLNFKSATAEIGSCSVSTLLTTDARTEWTIASPTAPVTSITTQAIGSSFGGSANDANEDGGLTIYMLYSLFIL